MERILDAEKAEDAKSVRTAQSPSNNNNNRMFEDKENQSPTLITDTTNMTPHRTKTFLFPNVIPDHKGFGTMLKPTEKKSIDPKGSDQLESFISDIEEHLIELALDPNNKYKPN
jgi:hypothetical protein